VKVEFQRSFLKDLQLIKERHILNRVRDKIEEVEKANSSSDISNLKKLKGGGNYYRIRIGDHRLGIVIESESIKFVRFLNRKDIYKYFP